MEINLDTIFGKARDGNASTLDIKGELARSRLLFYDWFEHDEDVGGVSDQAAGVLSSTVKREHAAIWDGPSQASDSKYVCKVKNEGRDQVSVLVDSRAPSPNSPSYLPKQIVAALPASSLDPPMSFVDVLSEESNLSHSTLDPRSQDGLSSQQSNPRKRHRMFLDAVEIRTPAWLENQRLRVKREIDDQKELDFFHPKWKIKRCKEDEHAGLGSVLRRVEALDLKPFPLELDGDLLDFTVSRDFISDTYGGNTQSTFPSIDEKKKGAHHSYRNFMFLNIEYNPYAPQRAGFPGLFYRCRTSDLPKVHRVFIRIRDGVWLYLGQYELVRSEPLSREEWVASSTRTKTTWSKHTSEREWGMEVRVRISLRKKLRREPTVEEIEAASGDGSGVTPEDVQRALDNGQEVINVWVMKCVAYDETFQREMKAKFVDWKPKPKKDSKAMPRNAELKPKATTGDRKSGKTKRQPPVTPEVVEKSLPEQKPSLNTGQEITDGEVDASSRHPRKRRKPRRYLDE